ncbi:MAG: hypothetical protein O7D94_09430 [Planctomycetota bacterium]|nr:hypothetical protein [Planctomycetota bacterium]
MLQVRSKDRETDRFIRLTSGGNVETLAFFPCDPERAHARKPTLGRGERSARAEEALDVSRFKSVRAFVYIDEDRVRIDVFMPVTLVETWWPIDRADRDFLEPAEMNAARDRLLGLFTHQNQLSIDGRRASPEAVQLEFLGPCAIGMKHREPTRRLGAWTARVGASLRYKVDSPPDNVELVWRLFNSAVLNAHATVVFNKDRHEHRLTTYQPAVAWHRSSQ